MGRAGKMAEVQGGRSLRPSERKARHNKVYTAKGPRDRRVRLSADTAIQFYDVQDRLGFERASEAVDWLIKKAKGSIDKLFGTSSSSPNSELLSCPGPESNAHVNHHEDSSILETEEQFNLTDDSVHTSDYNSMDNSFFPYVDAGNCSTELSFDYTQQGFENGQIPKMIMFNCKLDSRSGDYHQRRQQQQQQQPFGSNSTSLLLQPPALNLTALQYPGTGDLHVSGLSSDEIVKFYISGEGHGHPEQTVVFNQPAFVMPASHLE